MGDEVLVVGGVDRERYSSTSTLRDGAVLTTEGTAWRAIAEAPVAVGAENVASWTGSVLLVLANDGLVLSYDPAADRWDRLGSVVGPTRVYANSAWTGTELLVADGLDLAHPRAADQAGGWARAIGGMAFNPTTPTWRTLPAFGSVTLSNTSVWTGREWVRAAAPLDSSDPWPRPSGIGAYDPATDTWRALPALPGDGYVGVLLADHGALIAFDETSTQWRLEDGGIAWTRVGSVPAGENNSVTLAWLVGSTPFVDVGSGTSSYIAYRQASGAWVGVGPVGSEGDQGQAVQLASGDVFYVGEQTTSRLRRLVDPTEGVPACRADQLVASTNASMRIVLTNASSAPCTVAGDRPARVEFHSGAGWQVQPRSTFSSSASAAIGGYVGPNEHAEVDVVNRVTVPEEPCPIAGPFDGVRFSLPDGSVVEVAVSIDLPCPQLSTLSATA